MVELQTGIWQKLLCCRSVLLARLWAAFAEGASRLNEQRAYVRQPQPSGTRRKVTRTTLNAPYGLSSQLNRYVRDLLWLRPRHPIVRESA